MSRILAFICALLLASALSPMRAYFSVPADTLGHQSPEKVRGIQYASPSPGGDASQGTDVPLFSGFSLSADAVGAVMALTSPWGSYEGAARLHLKERYFPVFEMGWGVSDHTDATTDLHYKTHAPFFRIGMDYNFNKNSRGPGRILGGFRYAFSSFHYDLDGPGLTDPVWGTSIPYHFVGVHTSMHWIEMVFGLEARIVRFFHLGWSIRYKLRLHERQTVPGSAWYVPGYGRNGSHALGGTFYLVFDI